MFCGVAGVQKGTVSCRHRPFSMLFYLPLPLKTLIFLMSPYGNTLNAPLFPFCYSGRSVGVTKGPSMSTPVPV